MPCNSTSGTGLRHVVAVFKLEVLEQPHSTILSTKSRCWIAQGEFKLLALADPWPQACVAFARFQPLC